MTREEVIEAFAKGLMVKDRESGKVGEILVVDATDSTARLKGVNGWRQWAELEVADPEAIAELEVKAEKVKAALDGLLLKAPRIAYSPEMLEQIDGKSRGADARLLGTFPNGKTLIVTLSPDGDLSGFDHTSTLSDFTLIED